METQTNYLRFRGVLTAVTFLVFIIVVPQTIYQYTTTSQYFNKSNKEVIIDIDDVNYNDMTDGAIQARITMSNSLYQATLLLAAALAGLLIAQKGGVNFAWEDAPELIMFFCAGTLLILSFVFHALYVNEISYIYSDAGKMEDNNSIAYIFDEDINFLFAYQFWYFLCGVVLSAFTFISAHKLKGGQNE